MKGLIPNHSYAPALRNIKNSASYSKFEQELKASSERKMDKRSNLTNLNTDISRLRYMKYIKGHTAHLNNKELNREINIQIAILNYRVSYFQNLFVQKSSTASRSLQPGLALEAGEAKLETAVLMTVGSTSSNYWGGVSPGAYLVQSPTSLRPMNASLLFP